MANIYFKCSCEKSLSVDESGAGRTVKCPDCGKPVQVPLPEIRWYCKNCGEYMASSLKMAGEFIQCCTCNTSVQVPVALSLLSSRLSSRSTPQPKNTRPRLTLVLVALLVMGGAVFFYMKIRLVPPEVSVASTNAVAAVVSNPPPPPPVILTNMASVKPVFDRQLFAKSVEEWTPGAERELSQNHAALTTNETINIRLPTGLMVNGKAQSIGKDQVTVITALATDTVAFADMDFNNRLRCDPELRALWVALKAAMSARKDLDDKHIAIPQYNGADSLDELNAAAALGDPEAEYKLGQCYLKGENLKKDPGFAFLYFQMAAQQEHWLSAYCLGRMYLAGLAIDPDKAQGEKLIALAADKGCAAAQKFIEKRRQEKEEQKKLALQKQEKQRAAEAQQAAEASAQEAAEAARRQEAQKPKPSGIGKVQLH